MERIALQVTQRRITGAEIIDGQMHAHVMQALQQAIDIAALLQQQALGDLKFQIAGGKAGFAQDGANVIKEGTVLELPGRDVDAQQQIGMAALQPGQRRLAGLAQHVTANGHDQTAGLGLGNETVGRHAAQLRIVPA